MPIFYKLDLVPINGVAGTSGVIRAGPCECTLDKALAILGHLEGVAIAEGVGMDEER